MRVLIACEESQAVCKEFRAIGHEAYSCDIQECSGGKPEWHIQGDVVKVITVLSWDLIIIHPPCTYLTVAGNRHYAKNKPMHHKRVAAALFVQRVWDLATSRCPRVALENPVGCISTMCDMPKPQYIQPFEFGHAARKKTGLWLFGLQELKPTNIVEPELLTYICGDGRKTTFSADYMNGVNRSGKGDSSKKRSKTYPGIAKAMADQWGSL